MKNNTDLSSGLTEKSSGQQNDLTSLQVCEKADRLRGRDNQGFVSSSSCSTVSSLSIRSVNRLS